MIAGAIALFSLVSYYMKGQVNPITGDKQRVGMTAPQEIALGLHAAPQMAAQHGVVTRVEKGTRVRAELGAT
jgi:hypothetical protein